MAGKTTDGSWRPNTPFNTSDGIKVTMRRAAGLTPAGVLNVPMRFQVPPLNDLARPYQYNWATFDTISGGQRARPMGAQLLQIQMDTMLLDALAAAASEGVVVWPDAPDPQRVLDELRYIQGTDDARKGKAAPFRLTLNQPAVWDSPVVSMIAVLTSLQPTQHAGSLATEYLSATFLQYPESQAGRQLTHTKPARRHKLKAGDTLHGLAKTYLHQASAWRTIASTNGIAGVSPTSASELAAWAKKHHKDTLIIPRIELHTSGVTTP